MKMLVRKTGFIKVKSKQHRLAKNIKWLYSLLMYPLLGTDLLTISKLLNFYLYNSVRRIPRKNTQISNGNVSITIYQAGFSL